jgi:iron complex outermembrane receptor protein
MAGVAQDPDPHDLSQASLEQLMNIQVTSVSKKSESLSKTSASVFVITAQDIRRSGLHSLPEVLRLAPGVQVARSNAGSWAISIRGFNDEYSNKLLVLVDGRSIYSELFSGVFWDAHEMDLDNIERIEVVRGPVAAMWGTNAVNGVISIITKTADAAKGGSVTMEGGSAGDVRASARYGGQIGSDAGYRFSVHGSDTQQFTAVGGVAPSQGWMNRGADFRFDWKPTNADTLMVTGEASNSSVGHNFGLVNLNNPLAPPFNSRDTITGGDLLARWEHTISEQSTLEAQISWEDDRFSDPQVPLAFHILDVEVKQHVTLGSRSDVIWGVDGRFATYNTQPKPNFSFRPADTDEFNYSVFAEDHLAIVPDTLEFIAGVNLGHNSFTGLEVQPTARLLWTPNPRAATWVAISRAVRTPSLFERNLSAIVSTVEVQPGLFGFVQLTGNPAFRSEAVIAYEAGQRVEITKRLSLDASAYYNVYQHLKSQNIGNPIFIPPTAISPGYLEIPTVTGNDRHGETYGGELSATWTANQRWRLVGGYDTIFIHTRPYGNNQNVDSLRTEQATPRNQFLVRSNLDLTRRLQLDTAVYFNGALLVGQVLTSAPLAIPMHFRGDVRLGWRLTDRVEISAGVQDAFQARHIEFLSSRFPQALLVPRNIYGAVRWQF